MFSNRFNTKNDPLLEAVQNAMQDGEIRRQAEALVNEEFGVFNRRAVVREQLAAYDAAIEEAYECMKEGEKKDEKKEDKPKADYSKMREKMVGKGKDLETTRKIVGEGNDGNLANNYPPYDKVTRGDVIAGATGKDQMGGKKKKMEEEEQIDELTKPTAKTAHKVLNRSEDDLDKSAKAANRLYSWKMKRYPGKTKKYSGTAELPGAGNVEMHQDKYPGYVTKAGKLTKSATKDTKREIKDRLGKHAKPHLPEETQIDEISVGKASSYLSGRTIQARKGLLPGDRNPTSKTELKNMRNAAERTDKDYYKKRGFKKVDEESMDEAAYSAKAARAGKDIGKPGKEFKKIAKSAAARYGSEERGKKVAGAILKRIRAKHMREAIGTSQYGTATGSSFAAIDKARNAPSAGAPRPTARPDQTSINKLSSSRGLADSGSKYAGGKPHSSSTFASTAPGAQAKVQSSKTERGWADPGKYENEVKAKTGSMQQIRQGKVQEPSTQLGTPKGGESSTQSFLSKQLGRSSANAQGPEAPQTPQQRWDASRQASNQPSPGVAARTASAEIASGADKARDNSASVKKLMSMNESVQVGANRYRIV